jgi:hypothetical protein
MKIFYITFLCVISTSLSGQQLKTIDSVEFCLKTFEVPATCSADSKESFKCDDYSMFWKYINKEMIDYVNGNYLEILSRGFKHFKKKSTICYLLGTKVNCYIVSYENNSKTDYLIIAYGMVNDQSVLLNLNSKREMKTNANLPDFVKQVLRFKE